jgi:hypothetical protein
MTLGWQLVYVERLVAHHHPSPSRNTLERAARAARNRLLTCVLRRPWPGVARAVAQDVRTPAGRLALRQALPQVPRALARRRVVPPVVERARRILD